MTLLAAWVAFPLVLVLMSLGCGLLVERIAGERLPGALVPGVGLAGIAVIGQFTALSDATAELATPLAVGLATAGLLLAKSWRPLRPDPWALACGAVVFLLFGAPILLSGEATFGGYIRLDDTASWLALTERAMEQGANAAGLAPSTYEATLDFYLGSDYPVGGLVPLGVGGLLVGQDYAWVWQPYLSLLAAMLGLALYVALDGLGLRRPLRAGLAFVAAQPALVLGFALWGGFKEVGAAWLLALLALLAVTAVMRGLEGRRLLPLAVVSGGVLALLSSGGAVWLLPGLGLAFVAAYRTRGPRAAVRQAGWLAGAVVVLGVPALLTVGFLGAPAASTITDADRLANLIEPLSVLQAFGIWPAGDFRVPPDDLAPVYVLIALTVGAVAIGVWWLWRRRHWPILLYTAAALAAGLIVLVLGSHWVDAKALAIVSPALVLAALLGGVSLFVGGRRVEGSLLGAAIVAGVLWSNALAYSEVNLAPRERLAELEEIGHRFAGDGPTLMTEYEPYGARYLLRDADPESAGELRRRIVRLRNGGTVRKGGSADLDEFQLGEVLVYRTIVLRRSPTASRPPSGYRLSWRGRYWDVWQRPAGGVVGIEEHLPLGEGLDAVAVAECGAIQRLRGSGASAGRVVGVPRPPAIVVDLNQASHPASWQPDERRRGALRPEGDGTVGATLVAPRSGRYRVWVGGAVRGAVTVTIDGRPAGRVRHELSYSGHFIPLSSIDLSRGRHDLELEYSAGGLHPGAGGDAEALGPIALTVPAEPGGPRVASPPSPRDLCGPTLDWVEALRF